MERVLFRAARGCLSARQLCSAAGSARGGRILLLRPRLEPPRVIGGRRSFVASSSILAQEKAAEKTPDYHTIIDDKEKGQGELEKREFQAETRMLLDIVAKSLYSEKEVFVRELVSNASDALEKLRYIQMTAGEREAEPDSKPLEIHIATDKFKKIFVIQDTGVGMSKEEMVENLGTIAKSGSKEFLKQMTAKGDTKLDSIIGQFGVGFYSSFMVAEKVEVFSRSFKPGSKGYRWISDGSGHFEIGEAENVARGTKIVLHLKNSEVAEFADEEKIKEVVKRYSNFVSAPIFLNGQKVNTVQAVWLMDPKDVKEETYDEFYRFISHQQRDKPRYTLHYKTDAPVSIRALLYVPGTKPSLFDMARDADTGVALYSRRVLIQHKSNDLLPRWLRFMKGVIDSEDIPLNLSRELLQQTAVIAKIKKAICGRIIRFYQDQMKKEKERYESFYRDFNLFFKEGIMTSVDQTEKEDIAKLLLFESSNQRADVKISLHEYCSRLQAGQREIYYLCAPSRELAEASPYFEAFKERNLEVLFCVDAPDELVLLNLAQFERKNLVSVEKTLRQDKSDTEVDAPGGLKAVDAKQLGDWIKETLGTSRVQQVKTTRKLSSHPCVVTVEEMGAARQMLRMQGSQLTETQRALILQPTLEINPGHPLILKLNQLREKDAELAKMIVQQMYDGAMIEAGLIDESRPMIGRLNTLLSKLLEKL